MTAAFDSLDPSGFDADLLRTIRTWVETAEDGELFRINLAAWSDARGVALEAAIDHFLRLTHAGIFSLTWDMHCPQCNVVVDRADTLADAQPVHYCKFCLKDVESRLDDHFEVTFTISPAVRMVKGYVRYEPSANVDIFARGKAAARSNEKLDIEIPEHVHTLRLVSWPPVIVKPVPVAARAATPTLTFLGGESVETPESMAPGRAVLTITNRTDADANVMIEDHDMRAYTPDEVKPRLTGFRLISSPTFRELFAAETLSERESLSIRSIVVAFTDIVGSTALYRSIGDVNAYNAVRDHFEALFEEIRGRNGTVIKTLGDSVMATFLEPAAAVESILAARKRLEKIGLNIRAGIHQGPALAVTLNGRLDFFGTTVNEAARIQGTTAGDLVLSDAVRSDDRVRSMLMGSNVEQFHVELKGLSENYSLWRVMA